MPPADGTQAARITHAFRCDACKTPTHLSDLNDDMLCGACGEPEEDPENQAPTEAYLRRWESTWSV